jgi:hypothetical protein
VGGPRIAVKDNIDLAGVPTTAGCWALAVDALSASADAACLAGVRAAGAPIVGKTNLHELGSGGTGVNRYFGTPVNPFDPARIPGGSSSGNAVALAAGEADIAIGTDTAGSIRTPAACCGIVGLKTTWGLIALDGVWPLAPSLDTVGPMAADVAGVIAGMRLLDAGFELAPAPAPVIGRAADGGIFPVQHAEKLSPGTRLSQELSRRGPRSAEGPVNTGVLKYRYRDSNCTRMTSLSKARERSRRSHGLSASRPYRSGTLRNAHNAARLSQDCPTRAIARACSRWPTDASVSTRHPETQLAFRALLSRASRFLCRRGSWLMVTVTRSVSTSDSQFALSGTRSPKWILNASSAVVQFRVRVHWGTAFCSAR